VTGCSGIDWAAAGWSVLIILLLFFVAGFVRGLIDGQGR
jgi:hypothetical protein